MSHFIVSFLSVLAIVIPFKGLIFIAGVQDEYHLSVIITIPLGLFVISLYKNKSLPSKFSLVIRILISLIFLNFFFSAFKRFNFI